MPPSSIEQADLLDLKLMPAWVKEPIDTGSYANYTGEEGRADGREHDRRDTGGRRGPRRPGRPQRGHAEKPGSKEGQNRNRGPRRQAATRPDRPPRPELPIEVSVRFLPRLGVLDTVVAQIQSDALAYSLFSLARLFLEKPQRYEVSLQSRTNLFQLGEGGETSLDRSLLEGSAFPFAKEKFYQVTVTQSEPLKGNFTSVARCRLSGTVLGPTNHHGYQPRLRALYEQRFSRRMSFPDYQRQIEIVTDPASVEKWKEEARNVRSFTTLGEETPVTFQSAAEAERHFREHYLPNLIQVASELTIGGLSSRQLADRRLHRHIEEAWSAENRSPSHMMQELGNRFREAGLHVFRHRRGMLFVSSIRVRPFVHVETSISPQVKAILETVAVTPGIQRKELGEKLLTGLEGEEIETRKLALASDLRWLINEGYVIEFNDGSLDLPRRKTAGAARSAGRSPAEGDSAVKMENGTPGTPVKPQALASQAAAPAETLDRNPRPANDSGGGTAQI